MMYPLEELVPIVAKLTEKYTAGESSSITYEKAEQLMEAVLYCISELEESQQKSAVPSGKLTAQQAYEIGAACVREKAKAAFALYSEILPGFMDYGNQCLRDTFIKGLPAFFKWYDPEFQPQDTIITLDYPVLRDLSQHTGVDKVYEFTDCIRLEQIFLSRFQNDYVTTVLEKYHPSYRHMIDNLCEIVFIAVTGRMLAGKSVEELILDSEDYFQIQGLLSGNSLHDIRQALKQAAVRFLNENYEEGEVLFDYMAGSIDDIASRIKTAADHGTIRNLL